MLHESEGNLNEYSEFAVVILAKNEEARIGNCLDSVSSCKSRYLVDSGSSDRTVEIAISRGADVLTRVPTGPFIIGEQRNWALDSLGKQHEWVLFLDADERATPDYLVEVGRAVAGAPAETRGFWAAPKFIYKGTWLRRYMGYPNWHPRLVRTSTRLVGGVWETFPPGLQCEYIREPYLHFPDDRGFAQWLERHYRYALARQETQEMGGKSTNKKALQWVSDHLGAATPWARVLYPLFIRRGFLDGGAVWSYARRSLIYELVVAELSSESRLPEASQTEVTLP